MTRSAKKQSARLIASLVSAVMAAGAARAVQQTIVEEETEIPPLMAPQVKYFRLDVEDDMITSEHPGGKTSTDHLYVSPGIGIGWNYYLYHPNLMTFQILAEPGYSWQQYTTGTRTTEQDSVLVNGTFSATLLPLKPYSTIFNYSRSHGEYHYDFFNSATVDSEMWGATTGYRQGRVPFTISYQHVANETTGLTYNSSTEQTTLEVHAENERKRGDRTDLTYQYSEYDSIFNDGFTDLNLTHYVSITDTENFDKGSLNTSIYYNHYEDKNQASDNPTISASYNREHSVHLHSFYDLSVADYSTEGSDALNVFARAGLSHQLYESLNSTFDIHGSEGSSDSFGSTLSSQSFGASVTEAYTKRLGKWGRLTISDGVTYDFTEQDSAGGQLLIANESYAVPLTGIFFLKTPRVIAVQTITYNNGVTVTLVPGPGGDYDVISSTDPWQIQINSTGPNHVDLTSGNATVSVTYVVKANPTGSYSTFNNHAEVRWSFWKQRASVYARYQITENEAAAAGFVLENMEEVQVGADLNWRKLRLNANFTDRNSSLYDYQSISLSEGYNLVASSRQSAGVDFNQQWTSYGNTGRTGRGQDMNYYSFTAHHSWRLTGNLSWNNEAGYQLQEGTGYDHDSIIFRSALTWQIGKLDFKLGYLHEAQEYVSESRGRDYIYLNLRRNF